MKNKFEDASYAQHEEHYLEYFQNAEKRDRSLSWKRTDTVDAWNRFRLLSQVAPITKCYPGATWVTIGDGRFGSDAHYIESLGGVVTATDISDVLLREALAEGYITTAKKENAEALNFEDEEFDFSFCKDSLHHFPRPAIALYEMLRVARVGTVLIEPADKFADMTVPQRIYSYLKETLFSTLLGRKTSRFEYEEVGNFLFAVSRRELEKVAAGLNYSAIAIKLINTYYLEGSEDELLSSKGRLYRKTKWMLAWRNFLSAMGLRMQNSLVAIIFKIPPSPEAWKELENAGFGVTELPKNPYLRRAVTHDG